MLSAGQRGLWGRVALVRAFHMKISHRAKKNRTASQSRERNPVSPSFLLAGVPVSKSRNQGAAESCEITFFNLWASLLFLWW